MAKKPSGQASSVFESVSGAFGMVKDMVVPALTANIKQNFEQAMNRVEERLREMQAQLLRALAVWVLLFIAICTFAMGIAFLVIDMLGASRAVAFLAFSGILALAAILLHLTRPRYR